MKLNDTDKKELKDLIDPGNKHQKYFCQHLLDKHISIAQLEKWANFTKKSLFEDGKYFRRKDNIQLAFKRTFVRKIYFACDMDCEKFLVSEDIEKHTIQQEIKRKMEDWLGKQEIKPTHKEIEKKREGLEKEEPKLWFTRDYWNQFKEYKPHFSLKNVYPLSIDPNNTVVLEDAYDVIANYFQNESTSEIAVYELLFKGKNHNPKKLPAYVRAQSKIFKAIKFVLKRNKENNDPFLYKRTFSLARLTDIFSKNPDSEDDLKTALVYEASQETLVHIVESLSSNYADLTEFSVTTASRFRHHAIVDKTKRFFSEDYIVGPKGVIIPECVYDNDITKYSPINELVESYKLHTATQTSFTLKKGDVEYYLKKAIRYIEGKKKEIKAPLDLIKEKFPEDDSRPEVIQILINKEMRFFQTLQTILKSLNDKQTIIRKKVSSVT